MFVHNHAHERDSEFHVSATVFVYHHACVPEHEYENASFAIDSTHPFACSRRSATFFLALPGTLWHTVSRWRC